MADPARAAHDPDSRACIELEPPARLAHWAKELGVTVEALESAVQAVGPRLDRVKDHLTAGQAGSQQGG